nr:hypothetical protein HAGR004_14940 [Bdellovibrio sp. HAGR004]
MAKKTALSLTLIFILGSWPLRNLLVFNNPMYPLAIPGLTKVFPNYKLDTGRIEGQMPRNLLTVPQPLRFVVSVFELSRLSSGSSMPWNLDQYAEGGEKNLHHRLGGWGLITMVVLSTLVWLFLRRERTVGLVLISLVGLTSLTPQSHELRYWLYIPLVLAFLSTLSFFDMKSKLARTILFSLIFVNFIFVTSKVRPRLNFAPATAYVPEEAKVFWENALVQEEYKLCKLPNTIFFSGPRFNDFIVTDCH